MSDVLLLHEPVIRLGIFASVLAGMAIWEALRPRRARLVSRWARWPSNLAIVVLNTLAVRAIFPFAAVGLALTGNSAAGACSTISPFPVGPRSSWP